MKHLWARSLAPWRNEPDRCSEAGFTIIEMAVAVLVFALVASGVSVALGNGLNLARNNRNRSVAANLASAEIDKVRSLEFDTLAPGNVTTSRVVDDVAYTVSRTSEWVPQNATTSACDTPSGSIPAYMRVSVAVTWPNMAGAQSVKSQTVISPPVGAYDPNSGHIAVKVMDRNGQLSPANHQVTVNGPGGTHSQYTAGGCAFFAYLAPGNYSVSMSSTCPGAACYVDRQGVSNPSQTTTVTVGTIKAVQFDYDRAARLELTLGQDPTYAFPPGNMPVTIANSGLSLGKKKFAGTGPTRTIENLFPYESGYEVWVGDCVPHDPLGIDGTGTPYWDGAARFQVATEPGLTTSATVPMKLVEVRVFDSAGLQQANANVRAWHGTDAECATYDNLDMGNTSSLDPKVRLISLPFGTWTIRNGTSTTWMTTASLDPRTPDPMIVEVRQP